MSPKHKVLVIIYKITNGGPQILALKPNPEPNRNTDWYTLTGGVEKGEEFIDTAKRETWEEISINPAKVIDIKKQFSYTDHITGKQHFEHCFGAEIGNEKIILNEEHIDYKWLSPEEFVNTIWWDDDRTELKELVDKILKSS